MAEYSNRQGIPKETAIQALNTIIQLHFEKTLEKKKAIDHQKKKMHKHFLHFFIFLAVVYMTLVQPNRLRCHHCWMPIVLLSLAHLIFYVSVAQTLRCINGFKYQRRCHKLTLGLATEKLRELKSTIELYDTVRDESELEVPYQEPPDGYFCKFKRIWGLHFGFLVLIYAFMVASSITVLCL